MCLCACVVANVCVCWCLYIFTTASRPLVSNNLSAGERQRATNEHDGPEVKLALELSDEDVRANDVPLVGCLHRAQDVRHPFKLLLAPRCPQENDLKRSLELSIRC